MMRYFFLVVVGCLTLLFPAAVLAQQKEKFKPPEIKRVLVGFKTYNDREVDHTAYKVGLWTPIYIEVFGGTEGIGLDPKQKYIPYLEIVTPDSDDVGTTVTIPCVVEPQKERVFTTYIKTGHLSFNSREIEVVLHISNRPTVKPMVREQRTNLEVDAHLYVTLGPRITDLNRAVRKIGLQPGADKDEMAINQFAAHHLVYENEVARLPDRWFGYNGVDVAILATDKADFLNGLNNDKEKIKALAQWVRRGGRLIVPIAAAAASQQAVHNLLKNEAAWQPPIPVVPPKTSSNLQLERVAVENWGGVQGQAFERPGRATIPVATLDPGNVPLGDWDVLASAEQREGGHPLIARVRYGLGQITYIAFSLQDEHFFRWEGKDKFLQTMITNVGPKAPANQQHGGRGNRFGGFDDGGLNSGDPATQLLAELDKFGVTPIDFGYVALFIVLYILIVGPLDFFLLKFVFKRLEWTWITFPAVVLAVSVIAYFAAYALKGKDLKINKVDVVDFDLRTSSDPKQARVYGHSFFAILSPRIQNYTIGLEPNPEFWGASSEKPLNVDLMSWLGRPSGGPGDMGRSGSGGFFKRPYEYAEEMNGLKGVPIPVWTTKAFTASWEQQLTKSPFVAELVYHQKEVQGKDLKITGKLENHLAVDLVDVWLLYDDRFYLLKGGLKNVKSAPAGEIEVPAVGAVAAIEWVNKNDADDNAPQDSAGNANQTRIVKQFLVHESFDTQRAIRNHLLRPLDLGWRIKEEPRGQRDRRVREAVLIGRVRYPAGNAQAMTDSTDKPLPTKLWLGDLPDGGRPRPDLSGQLNQDTYVRVILPIRPAND